MIWGRSTGHDPSLTSPPLLPPSHLPLSLLPPPPPYYSSQALLQASGKIKRPKSQRKTKQLPSQSKGKEKKEKEKEVEGSERSGAVVPDAIITEFFEVLFGHW